MNQHLEAIGRDFGEYVDKHGIDHVPLEDERLRPLLGEFRKLAKASADAMLIGFDLADAAENVTKVYQGLLMAEDKLPQFVEQMNAMFIGNPVIMKLSEELGGHIGIHILKRDGMALVYQPLMWTPASALGNRRN